MLCEKIDDNDCCVVKRAVHFQEPDILSVSSNDRLEESKCLTLGRRGHQKIEFAYVHEKKRPILITKSISFSFGLFLEKSSGMFNKLMKSGPTYKKNK